MKLKINKACDLSSISVLPPQSRKTSAVSSGLESSSSIFGRSQTASQLRPQQPQQSQLTLSQGVSSQHGLFSQFSQNSQDDILTNEKIGSQERENSARRTSCLPPVSYSREESQMMVSRNSNNLVRKWPGQEVKCQISEELEHRMGMIETSLSRLGMILDSVQSDIMQVNKGTKEDCRVLIESDDETDAGFSCLLKEKGTEINEYSKEQAEEETARILRKARRRKRKLCNTIIIN
ncbi:hypothetical protein MIMGU_mgv1a025416mg [Erythranthe guttata]|uniref:Uncharacterized protein n=1 Tax=Erythranthe guttata TaxID=4155 RepID=A0A022QZY8_ERYGU|nr:hypothetical protein MIMGU_mgv1a025416mg [Erythranthe guttata]